MRNPTRAAVALSLLGILAGCPRPFWLGFDGVPQPGRPSFRLSTSSSGSKPVSVHAFRVFRCYEPPDSPDRLVWVISYDPRSGKSDHLKKIDYGSVPAGFREIVPSRPFEPKGCYVVQAVQSEDDRGALLFLRGTPDGSVVLITGFDTDSMAPASARPQVLPDSLSGFEVQVPPSAALSVAREEFSSYGLPMPQAGTPDSVLISQPLALHHNWGAEPLDARINCGRYSTGENRVVMLPLADDPVGGYGMLTLSLRVSVSRTRTGTRLRMNDEVILYPPWYEHGDRPQEQCHITQAFAAALVSGIRARSLVR